MNTSRSIARPFEGRNGFFATALFLVVLAVVTLFIPSDTVGGAANSIIKDGRRGGPAFSSMLTGWDWKYESDITEGRMGYYVDNAGDLNGDGYGDVAVSVYGYSNGETNEGASYVFYGSASGFASTPDWIAEGNQAEAWFAIYSQSAGDVNGDGYDDLVVGAPRYDHGQTDEGALFLYYGGPSGLSTTPDWIGEIDFAGAYLGVAVSADGDVNGDGYDDVLAGASYYSNPQCHEGAVFLFYGGPDGPSSAFDWHVESNRDDDCRCNLGAQTAYVDVNGDGYDDIVAGLWGYSNPEYKEGAVWVFHGGASGPGATPDWAVEGNVSLSYFHTVSKAGDVNGDGYEDLLIGGYHETDEWRSRVYCYLGSPTGLSTYSWWKRGDQAYCYMRMTSSAGDINGDGYSDVVIGAHQYDDPEPDEGKVYVYCGSPTGLLNTPDWTAEGNQAGAWFGRDVACAGDVNGDGYDDILIGAGLYDGGQTNEGAVFLYYGCGSGCTEPGADVVVQPIDRVTQTSPVTVTFDNVSDAGITYVESASSGPRPPSLYRICSHTYYEVTTTAEYSGTVEICVDVGAADCAGKKKLGLYHFTNGDWVDCTTSYDADNHRICGEVTALSTFAVMTPVELTLDIYPESCPNPFNIVWLENLNDESHGNDHAMLKKGGVLPAALAAHGDFDVHDVDVQSLRLEGCTPLRTAYEDVSRPLDSDEECACSSDGPDGYVDLTIKFSRMELASLLTSAQRGDVVPFTLTGSLLDGTPFQTSDCVVLLTKESEPGIADPPGPEDVVLLQATPNPFNPWTRISFYLPGRRTVSLEIFDCTGRLVARLLDRESMPEGQHAAEWRGLDERGVSVASGVYYYRLKTGDAAISKKMILVR